MLSAIQKRLLAVVLGVVVAIATMAAFTLWLQGLIDRRGREEVEVAAQRSIQLAEMRIASALKTLDELAGKGVDDCRGRNADALRQGAFFNPSVKEIAVVSPDGRVVCTSSGAVLGPRAVLASQPLAGSDNVTIDVVRIGDLQTMIRITRRADPATGLAALIPALLFGATATQPDVSADAHMRMTTPDGTVIVDRGKPVVPDSFMVTRQSERYGLVATVSLPRSALRDEIERLQGMATAFGATIFVAILALALLLPRRRWRHDPLDEFKQAIAANEFVPFYQPVVDIRTGRLRGAEVLVRWRKSDGSFVLPSAFIPFAESSGLIIPLTRALMRRVCAEAGEALGQRPEVKIGFNLAAPHFADDRIIADVRDIFGNSPIPLRQVVLEVTERQPLENLVAARRVIAGLQELGCGVAIDDVGTGHGGLSYILKLGADTIKIDKLFVDALDSEHHSTTILETLVDLARSMRMDVVAEGVESFEQVLKLRDLGILAAQGHVFCPPLPGGSFLELVEAIAPVPRDGQRIEALDDDATPGVPAVAAA